MTEYGTWNLRYLNPEFAEDVYKCPPVEKYEVSREQGLIVFGTIDWVATTLADSANEVHTQGISSHTVLSNLALRKGRIDISDIHIHGHFFSRKHMGILISKPILNGTYL